MSSPRISLRYVVLAACGLAVAGCAQAEGEVCQLDSDCESGLVCCKPSPSVTVRGLCARTCSGLGDGGSGSVDAGGADAGVADAGVADAGRDDADAATGEQDAGGSEDAGGGGPKGADADGGTSADAGSAIDAGGEVGAGDDAGLGPVDSGLLSDAGP